MSLRSLSLAGWLLLGLVPAACGDDPPSPAAPPSPGDGTGDAGGRPAGVPVPPAPDAGTSGTPDLVPEDPAVAQARVAAQRVAMDREAHRLLDEFRARVHDPARDEGLRRAEGTIDLEIDGARGAYAFSFDASKKDDAQIGLTTSREDRGLHADAARQARRFAVLALRGAYSQVLSYTPPAQWHVVKAEDGRTIVVAPPFRTEMGVSYRLDGRGLVEMSGATDGKRQTRAVFHWTDWKGRSLLARSVEDEGKATIGYEYAEEKGVTVLRRATLTEGAHRCAATFVWSLVETD